MYIFYFHCRSNCRDNRISRGLHAGWDHAKGAAKSAGKFAKDRFDEMYKRVSERNAMINVLLKGVRFIEEECNLIKNPVYRGSLTDEMKKSILGKIFYNIEGLTKNVLLLKEENIHIPQKVYDAIENIIAYGRSTVESILPEIP